MKHEEALKAAIRTFRDDEDDVLFRLALLKARADYRAFFTPERRKTVQTAYSKIAEENAKGPGYIPEEETGNTVADFLGELHHRFGVRRFAIPPRITSTEWLDVLDPLVDAGEIPPKVLRSVLPRLFYTPGVSEVIPTSVPRVGRGESPTRTTSTDCAPYERLYKIDLRKKSSQLLREFKPDLEAVDAHRGMNPAEYASWKQDRSRKRKEAWQHLRVWQSWWRIDKPLFATIGRELGITEDAAKKSFQRAFELIYGTPFTREAWEEKRAEFAILYPDHFEGKRSTRESIFENFEEVSDAHSFNEWRTREEENK